MKKILTLALAAAALLTACQKEGQVNNEANVTIEVGVPTTKAIGDGTTATKLYYEVYHVGDLNVEAPDETDNLKLVTEGTKDLINLTTTLDLTLVRGNKYLVLFWAQAEGAPYNVEDLRSVGMNYNVTNDLDPNGNREERDAFCNYCFVSVDYNSDNNTPQTCELKRPFAQINFVATDYGANADIKSMLLTESRITVKDVATTLNVYKCTPAPIAVSNSYVFSAKDVVNEDFDSDNDAETWFSMNYVLLQPDVINIEVKAEFDVAVLYKSNETIKHTVKFGKADDPAVYRTVSAAANYRTNIVGNLITETNEVDIVVRPGFVATNNVNAY